MTAARVAIGIAALFALGLVLTLCGAAESGRICLQFALGLLVATPIVTLTISVTREWRGPYRIAAFAGLVTLALLLSQMGTYLFSTTN